MAYKQEFKEEDLEEWIEDSDGSLSDWIDTYLGWVDYADPGPKKVYSFKFFGKSMAVALPMGVDSVLDTLKQEDGLSSTSELLKGLVLTGMLYRIKAMKTIGDKDSSLLALITLNRSLKIRREMEEMRQVLDNVDGTLEFWIAQKSPDPVAREIRNLIDVVDQTKDKDLRMAKIKLIVERGEFIMAGLNFLNVENHTLYPMLITNLDAWKAELANHVSLNPLAIAPPTTNGAV